jgi:hypothetical protein
MRSFGPREALASDPNVAKLREPISTFLSADHEWNFAAIERLIPIGDPALAVTSRRKIQALTQLFREELIDIIGWSILAAHCEIETVRHWTKIHKRIVVADNLEKISEATSELPDDMATYYFVDNENAAIRLRKLCKAIIDGANIKRREFRLDQGGRPAMLVFKACVLLLRGAFERATGCAAGVSRVRHELVFKGSFVALVETSLAVICALSPRPIAMPRSNYDLGRQIERLFEARRSPPLGFVDAFGLAPSRRRR